jgi:hypothetical protein
MRWEISRGIALMLACVAAGAMALAACGESEKRQRAERAAAEVQREAAAAAAEDERLERLKKIVKRELALEQARKDRARAAALERQREPTPGPDPERAQVAAVEGQRELTPRPNPAIRPGGMAVLRSGVTDEDMRAAEAAMLKVIEIRGLPRLKEQLIAEVRGTIPHRTAAQFRDVHVNTAHNAACGEVDFEYWLNGRPIRSGYRRFVIEFVHYRNSGYDTDEGSGIAYHSAIDIDYQNRRDRYNELSKTIDCTPDPRS